MLAGGPYRSKWGVIIPSTNVMVEHDFAALCPYGVTVHSGRAYIASPSMASDSEAKTLLDEMDAGFSTALRDVLTTKPDLIVIAMAAEIMRRGVRGGEEFTEQVAQDAGLPVVTGPEAVIAALRLLNATTIGLLTPYQPESDELTRSYFEECGFEVVKVNGLRCTSATDIAEVSSDRIVAGLRELDSQGVSAIVQVGTNLNAVALAAEAERWLGTPTISMNAATVWHALRRSGITDQRGDAGFLLRDHCPVWQGKAERRPGNQPSAFPGHHSSLAERGEPAPARRGIPGQRCHHRALRPVHGSIPIRAFQHREVGQLVQDKAILLAGRRLNGTKPPNAQPGRRVEQQRGMLAVIPVVETCHLAGWHREADHQEIGGPPGRA